MARILAEAPMTTKAARSRLGSGLYWRGLDAELHLGYRKGKRSGRWVVRWFSPDRSYRQETIATADDRAEADGTYVLTFQQASKRALKAAEAWRFEAAARAAGVIPTVRAAALAYVEAREAIEKETGRFYARGRFKKHILGDEIADWNCIV